MKGSVGEKLRNRFRSWPVERWISLLVVFTGVFLLISVPISLLVLGFTGVFLLICILWIVFRILRVVAQGAWGFVFEAIPAMFKSMTVAPPAFRKTSRLAHCGAVFYICQYLLFLYLVKVKSGFVVGRLGWIPTWYAIFVMGIPMGWYLSLLVGLYQFYCRRGKRLPSSDVEWQTILVATKKLFRRGTVIGITSSVIATPLGEELAALLKVHGLPKVTLIQLVELYLSNKIGVKTNTFWTGLSTRRPGVVSKETPYGLLAAKVWRRALCWWVVPIWQGAVLTGSSGAWAGSTCLGVDPTDLVKAVTPTGYKHPAVKLVGRVRGELSELARSDGAGAARTARRNRQYGRWAGLRLRLLGKFLMLMLLQPLGRASIRSAEWLLPKRENAQLQSLMRRVRGVHVLGVILLFTPVMLLLLARGAVMRHKSIFMISSPLVAQVGIKGMIEEESGDVYYLAEYGQWPSDEEAEMEVFGNAWRLMVVSVPDTAINIGPTQGAANWLNGVIGNHNAQVYRVLPGGLNIIFGGPMTAAQAQALGQGSKMETSEPEVESNTL